MLLFEVTKKWLFLSRLTVRLTNEIQQAAQRAAIPLESIVRVIIVGGRWLIDGRVMCSSLIPAVQDALRGLVGERLVVPQHCQEVIAEGSVLQAELRREHHSEWMEVEITCSEEIASKGAATGGRCGRALWRVECEDRRERRVAALQSGDSGDEGVSRGRRRWLLARRLRET